MRHYPALLAAASLALSPLALAGCATAPTTDQLATARFFGGEFAFGLKLASPKAFEFVHTFASSLRSVAPVTGAVAGAALPTPEFIASQAQLWAQALPISEDDKAKAVKFVSEQYAIFYPKLKTTQNSLQAFLAFADGFDPSPAQIVAIKAA